MNEAGVIVGIGSEQGADHVGLEVIEVLRQQAWPAELGCGLYSCTAPAAQLPGMLSDAGWAVLVDGIRAGGKPGTARRYRIDELLLESGSASSHGIGASATLALLRALGQLPARTAIIGIEIGTETDTAIEGWAQGGAQAVRELATALACGRAHSPC